ncbi:sigma-70 family RNA polymerase sigma factor [Pseudoalteromonas ulvae]|uniref:sigma-70 family RNA polymerase sigma factor n=1 Tax=Pseudoalteromonas ulvae TaxID=107327 RepID=UPI001D03A1CB|nr:sigma-70 family RNA polymerase sigma factor [Pseudoalteromonas ulvae]
MPLPSRRCATRCLSQIKWDDKQNTEVLNPSNFCFQVARDIALDMLRKQNREKIVDLGLSHLEQISDDSTDIEDGYENEQLAKKVNDTLLKLSKRHQNIISFYRSGTFKQKDIASVYQISPTLVNFMIKEVIHSCQAELDVL